MINRRTFNKSMAVLLPMSAGAGCASSENAMSYDAIAAQTYRHTDNIAGGQFDAYRELIRYATMAANSHNSQPWKFMLGKQSISIVPDFARRCAVVDPTDHHIFASLGCAAENILIAAGAFGLKGELVFEETPNPIIRIFFSAAPSMQTELFQAIPERQCTRGVFNGTSIDINTLKVLEKEVLADVDLQFLTGEEQKNAITEFVVEGNTAQMDDAEWVAELRSWIRFNEAQALKTLDGLTYRSTGSPSAPRWLGEIVFRLMFRKESENDKYREQIASSSGVAVFSCAGQSKLDWINAGRSYQRFAVHSTALGIRHAFINQPMEIESIRPQLASYLNLDNRLPDLIIRYGYGEPTPRTLRRSVDAVLENQANELG